MRPSVRHGAHDTANRAKQRGCGLLRSHQNRPFPCRVARPDFQTAASDLAGRHSTLSASGLMAHPRYSTSFNPALHPSPTGRRPLPPGKLFIGFPLRPLPPGTLPAKEKSLLFPTSRTPPDSPHRQPRFPPAAPLRCSLGDRPHHRWYARENPCILRDPSWPDTFPSQLPFLKRFRARSGSALDDARVSVLLFASDTPARRPATHAVSMTYAQTKAGTCAPAGTVERTIVAVCQQSVVPGWHSRLAPLSVFCAVRERGPDLHRAGSFIYCLPGFPLPALCRSLRFSFFVNRLWFGLRTGCEARIPLRCRIGAAVRGTPRALLSNLPRQKVVWV